MQSQLEEGVKSTKYKGGDGGRELTQLLMTPRACPALLLSSNSFRGTSGLQESCYLCKGADLYDHHHGSHSCSLGSLLLYRLDVFPTNSKPSAPF